jgi:hypothetical protein
MKLFTLSPACTSRTHCANCRNQAKGRRFREQLTNRYELPAGGVDFDCPHGVPWGYDGSDPNLLPKPEPAQLSPQRQPPQPPKPVPFEQWPPKIKRLAGKAIPADRGIGDVLQRRYARWGGEIFKSVMKSIGIECGCAAKQAKLNALYPLRMKKAGGEEGGGEPSSGSTPATPETYSGFESETNKSHLHNNSPATPM